MQYMQLDVTCPEENNKLTVYNFSGGWLSRPSDARATWPPLHHGYLEEGRPHKSTAEKINVLQNNGY